MRADADLLLQIGTEPGSNTRIYFFPVIGASTTNTSALTVNPDSGPFFADALGQVAFANFVSSPVDLDWCGSRGGPMILGTSSAPQTDAFTNGPSSAVGTFLMFGDVFGGSVSGSLAASTLNPFGTTSWQSSTNRFLSQSDFDLINSSGDIVVVTDPSTDTFQVIGQWSIVAVPEPSTTAVLISAGTAMLALTRRRLRKG